MTTLRAVPVVALAVLAVAAAAGAAGQLDPQKASGEADIVLENIRLGLSFDAKTGTLVAVRNKLTAETYQVAGDEFAVEAAEFRLNLKDARLTSLQRQEATVKAVYRCEPLVVEVTYALCGENHFAEKRLTLTSNRDYGLKRLLISQPVVSGQELHMVRYGWPTKALCGQRKPGEEPGCTFFGRSSKGGFFTGVEMPFAACTLTGNRVALEYAPSLKVKSGERLACEPAYFGVYRRGPLDRETKGLPLRSESDAMVAMTSAILGPPRFGLVPMACGWHSEMEHNAYTKDSLEGDMKSLDFLAACGIDWVSDSHPWGGETKKMNALGAADKYELDPQVRKFLEHAKKVGVNVVMWSTLTNTHPWWLGTGRPFRPDKPEWLMPPFMHTSTEDGQTRLCTASCMGNKPFVEWLTRVTLDGLATGYYKSWAEDGDFFGTGGWVYPANCRSDRHNHLPGDSNYACQRALGQLIASVREHYPQTHIFTCRPPQDLGVWSLRNVDACFTIMESGTTNNIAGGDQIRTWSRVRVQREFLPHYLDQPLAFPSWDPGMHEHPKWPSEKLAYILLSGMSCSPNLLYYLPTKTGIPDRDKAEIHKWLAWGRKNEDYLKVRKDLPDWPAAGKVDGSAHIVGDRGLIFLFNPNKDDMRGEFALTGESIGLTREGSFQVTQEYPPSDRTVVARSGETARRSVPRESAVVLRIEPAPSKP